MVSGGGQAPGLMRSEAGMAGGLPEPGEAEVPPAERLINLTEHNVMLVSQPQQAAEGPADALLVRVSPDGRFARVDDDAARLQEHLLNTDSGVVRLTRLRRLGRLVDLPPPQPRTRYVVSRVTALAARGRSDLAFPFGEIRDGDGRVVGARGLASFRSRSAIWRRFGERRDSALERRGRPLSRQWLTGVLFATAPAAPCPLLRGARGLGAGGTSPRGGMRRRLPCSRKPAADSLRSFESLGLVRSGMTG